MNTGIHVVTAPFEVVVNAAGAVVGRNDPSAIFDPYLNLGRAAGDTIASATSAAVAPWNFLYEEAQRVASQAGAPGQFIFDVATFQYNFINQWLATGGYAVANVLRQQNPLQLVAAPLASAIRAARERHSVSAQPIPQDVVSGLAPFFGPAVLDRARYAVGVIEISLPNFINQGSKLLGSDHAVVVDDIIVFSSPPPSFEEGSWWWGHEMTHVRQYSDWGVDGFAWRYVQTFGNDVEGEANQQGNNVLNRQGSTNYPASKSPAAGAFGALYANPVGIAPSEEPVEVPEFFVTQCFFANDPRPFHCLITNTNRIIIVDPFSGRWMQVGWATPPRLPDVAWSFDTPNWRYAVMGDGRILLPSPFTGWAQVGQAFRMY